MFYYFLLKIFIAQGCLLFTGQKLKFMTIKMMNFMKVKQDTVVRDMHES